MQPEVIRSFFCTLNSDTPYMCADGMVKFLNKKKLYMPFISLLKKNIVVERNETRTIVIIGVHLSIM